MLGLIICPLRGEASGSSYLRVIDFSLGSHLVALLTKKSAPMLSLFNPVSTLISQQIATSDICAVLYTTISL